MSLVLTGSPEACVAGASRRTSGATDDHCPANRCSEQGDGQSQHGSAKPAMRQCPLKPCGRHHRAGGVTRRHDAHGHAFAPCIGFRGNLQAEAIPHPVGGAEQDAVAEHDNNRTGSKRRDQCAGCRHQARGKHNATGRQAGKISRADQDRERQRDQRQGIDQADACPRHRKSRFKRFQEH